jgi:hypothetical protein
MDSIRQVIQGLVAEQMAPWIGGAARAGSTSDRVKELSTKRETVVVFEVSSAGVSSVDKRASISGNFPMQAYDERVAAFTSLLESVVALGWMYRPVCLAIDIGDGAAEDAETPIFSFQKILGERNLLIPDVELIQLDYLRNIQPDTIDFDEKLLGATFSGSTTGGGLINATAVRAGAFPRLRAARRFQNNDLIKFNLSQIVQADLEAEALLRAEGFGCGFIPWVETYKYKFGISIDGNGAACSRPAILLASHCALLKYRSNSVLFYSYILKPGEHFIDIEDEGDIIRIVSDEANFPGKNAKIAVRGNEFARSVLSKEFCVAYTHQLIYSYLQEFFKN